METSKILRNMILFIRQSVSLNDQCGQVNCLVEMAPSAPSWHPPHQRGEFDGFQGRRVRPNQCRHKTIVSGLFNIPNPQKKSQKKNRTIWSIPKPARAKPTVPSSVSRKAILEQHFHQPQHQAQLRTQRMTEQMNISSSIGILNQNFAVNNESKCAESEFSKRETRNRLRDADIATDQTKPFNADVSPRNVLRSNHRRKVAPSDPSLIKPSGGQIQEMRPKKPKWNDTSIYPNISRTATLNPKDDST